MDRRLYRAAQRGHMNVLREYQPEKLTTQLTPYKNTVLHVAALTSNFSSEGAIKFISIVGPADLLFSLNSNGDTCMHVAAKKGQFNLIEGLIGYMKQKNGPEVEAGIKAVHQLLRITNSEGNMALHEAVKHGHHLVVELLVKEDVDLTHPPNKAGKSPLFLAAEKKDNVSIELILKNSISPSYAGPHGTTALHAAAIYNATECLQTIKRKYPTLIKQVDDFGWNPLHFAAYFGSKPIVRALLIEDKQMAYETINEDSKTPLHLAALNDNLAAVEEIYDQCPDSLEALTSQGQNALHLARINGTTKVKAFLLGLSINPDTRAVLNCGSSPSSALQGSNASHPYFEEMEIYKAQKEEKEFMEDAAAWKERANTHLIVATLITTISFAAGFTLPGGYDGNDGPNQGMAVLTRKTAFKTFVIADTLAMIFSTAAVFLHFIATVDQRGTEITKRYLYAGSLILYALLAMIIAFMTGLYVVLPFPGLAITVCVVCTLSLALFIYLLLEAGM